MAHVAHCKEALVEEHHHAQQHEKHSGAGQPDPNFCETKQLCSAGGLLANGAFTSVVIHVSPRVRTQLFTLTAEFCLE